MKTEATLKLEKLLKSKFKSGNDFFVFECTIGWMGSEIVDCIMYNCQREVYCYEIKQSVSDFHSKNKLTFIGNKNYFVMPYALYEKVKDELYTKEEYKDMVQVLFDNAEEIAHINKYQAIRCMAGMSKEKLKALKHPYPTIVDKINKYGYDPKQLHHILRMNDFIKKYAILEKPYKECLIPDNKEYLIQIKKGVLSEDEATQLAVETDEDTYDVKNWATGFDDRPDVINQKGLDILDKTKYEILKMRYREELK